MRVVHACWPAPGARHSRVGAAVGRGLLPRSDTGRRGRRPRISPHPYAVDAAELADHPRCRPAAAARQRRAGPAHAGRVATPLPRAGPRGRTERDRSGPPARLAGAGRAAGCGSDVRLVVRAGSDGDRLRRLRPPPGRAGRLRRRPGGPGPGAADRCWRTDRRAVWRPVLTGPDAAWARVLATAMPPAARAPPTRTREPLTAPGARAAAGRPGRRGGPGRAGLGRGSPSVAPAYADQPRLAGRADRHRPHVRRRAAEAASPGSRPHWLAGRPTPSPVPVRACFRLVEPADGRRRRGLAGPVRAAGRRRAEPGRRRRRGLAVPRQAAGAGPPRRRAAGDLPGRAGQGRPAVPRAGRRPAHRPAARPRPRHRRRAPVPAARPPRRWPPPGSASSCPGWWTRPSSRLGLRLTAATPAPAGAGRRPVPRGRLRRDRRRSATTWRSATRC